VRGPSAWHPRRSSLANPLADLEERKTLILLGMVGAIVAELSGSSQTLAFVHLRYRRAPPISNRARQPETRWKSHYGRGGRARLRHGIVGHGGVRHRLQLGPRLLARFTCELPDQDSTRGRRRSAGQFLAWCSRCLSRIIADCKVPRFTKTRDRWCSSSTFQREIDPRKLKQKLRAKLKKSDTSKIDVDVGVSAGGPSAARNVEA